VSDTLLETGKMREERERVERNKFDQTIIRVVFPYDKLILQAFFKPGDPISVIIDVVKKYIDDGDIYLFTAPPKEILLLDTKLIDLKLVPTGLIYCGTKQNNSQGVIKEQFRVLTTPFMAASQLAMKQLKSIYKSSKEKNLN